MEIQLALRRSTPNVDFNFDSTCSSPYLTAPSSPLRFPSLFFSAPASPSRSGESRFYGGASPPEKPGTPKNRASQNGPDRWDQDFAFDSGGKSERVSLSAADELFSGGVIRPLDPPPAGHRSGSAVSSPGSKKSRAGGDRGSRSLSPIRVAGGGGNSSNTLRAQPRTPQRNSTIGSILSSVSPARTRRRWKLRDLFRSASEGRATGKEAAGRYEMLPSAEELSLGVAERRRGGAAVSAHEEHYMANRAAAEEMRRRTLLPYRQGLFGCLGFNSHISTTGIGSLTRG